MSNNIELYVYDLSNGMARQWGRALTGRDVEGIWHTSLVLFGMEVFYGQGIDIVSPPGTTHHGVPLKKLSMGTTMLDKATFLEYIEGMREVYRADKYHLLDFNCNVFTNDVLNFLNGKSIPADILNLPAEILSTPFGQQMRPMIDQMFSGRNTSTAQTAVNHILNDDVSRQSLTSNLSIVSSSSSLLSLVSSNKAVAVMYTSLGCGPCDAIKPYFEELARTSPGVKFGIVELSGPGGQEVAADVGDRFGGAVRATPTFRFWEGGKVIGECKGADKGELKTQVGILEMGLSKPAPPAHPMASVPIPNLRKLAASRTPVTYTTPPSLPALSTKLSSILSDAAMTSPSLLPTTKATLVDRVVPLLSSKAPAVDAALIEAWAEASLNALDALDRKEWFPALDLLRLGLVLYPSLAQSISPVLAFALAPPPTEATESKALLLTLLKLVSNALPHPGLSKTLIASASGEREATTALVVRGLLSPDAGVRRVGAGLVWSLLGRPEGETGEWEVEIASAVLEALGREEDAEVVHRLAASLGVLMLLSTRSDDIKELLNALDVKDVLKAKEEIVKGKPEVLAVLREVAQIV